jgi:hypothetical protein
MAFDFPAAPAVGDEYVSGGATYHWTGTTWDLAGVATAGDYVEKAGDTMTGVLTISGVTNPTMVLDNPQGANNRFEGRKDGVTRWSLDLGSHVAENASNAGSDFVIYRYVNDGSTWTRALQINRADGLMTLSSGINLGSVAQDAANLKNLSKHLALYGTTFGFNVTGSTLNYHVSTGSKHDFHIDGVNKLSVQGTTSYLNTGLQVSGQIKQTGNNHILCSGDGYGVRFHDDAHIYKAVGIGMALRKPRSNTQWKIENQDGGGRVDIATASLTTFLDMGLALPELANDAELAPFAREDNDNKGFDLAKVVTLMLAKIRALECEIDVLKKRK